ncbi:MAG: pentapeptide repeat-containing protein [Tildeniella nuda ZEHNDER 1965/U140]|nr:pentapeptide repeat-containing protein [Tildeniella nuda ZEHNDER 1965/U140]
MKTEDVLKRYAAGERTFAGINLNEANLSGADLSHADFSGGNLSVANLSGANLSETNLSRAKLNVAKLSGANLTNANLSEAILNVANLTLADLTHAELSQASLVRAELTRADLSSANLSNANLSGADLKDAKLRNANLTNANLSRADLKWIVLTGANLTGANLHGTDLSSADCSGADLSSTELRQSNLSRTNLRGVNLSGANLRWADLSGADLSGADLSGAKLSGATMTGANLSNANLIGTTLVHVDLTRANLIGADWVGADLSGATLTGAKLYDVPRFGVKTDGMICEWVDLSPIGDQSQIYRFSSEDTFFYAAPPTVRLIIDDRFNQDAHYALAVTYRQMAQHYHLTVNPPNIQVGRRRTTLTFELNHDRQLFLMCCVALFPFKDAPEVQQRTITLVKLLLSAELESRFGTLEWFQPFQTTLTQTLTQINEFKLSDASLTALSKIPFFQAPTKTSLINSSNQSLPLYSHPLFGKRMMALDPTGASIAPQSHSTYHLPPLVGLVSFIQGFHGG